MSSQLFTGTVYKAPDRKGGFAALSLLLHALVLALLIFFTEQDVAVPGGGIGLGDGGGGGGGGGGGEEVLYVQVARPAPPPPPPPDDPEVPELEIDLVVPPPIIEPEVVFQIDSVPLSALEPPSALVTATTPTTGDGAGTGTGSGPGTGGGSGGGDGDGVGPGSGSGRGPGQGGGEAPGRPPRPRMLLLPPNAPRDMRGKTIAVRLVVDATGAVSDVALIPETGDDDFDRDIRRTALAWQFYPGTDAAGRVISTAYEMVLTF